MPFDTLCAVKYEEDQMQPLYNMECFFFFGCIIFNENLFLARFCPQRDDMEVLDEPLYANFLRVTGYDRPYREELLSKMVCISS